MKPILEGDEVVVHMSGGQLAPSASLAGEGGAEWGRRLLVAARCGDTALVRALVGRGAPFTADWLGTTALHLAAAHAHHATAAALLRAGLSRDARNKLERTPLHVAAAAGHARVVQVLLEAGAAADARDMLRMTPLHWAAERGHTAVAALLVRAGADPAAVSKFLKTPLSLARDPELRAVLDQALRDRHAAPDGRNVLTERLSEERDRDPLATVHVEPQRKAENAKTPKLKPLTVIPGVKQTQKVSHADTTSGRTPTATSPKTETERNNAARLLRAHGITLLPTDDTSTVLNALQSGRTIVLSDAGKLMLKESVCGGSPGGAGGAGGAGGGPGPGVVLQASPARAPPQPGAPVFTLNRARGPHTAPATHTQAKRTEGARPTVKIIMNRANLHKLLAADAPAQSTASSPMEVTVSSEEPATVAAPPTVAVESAATAARVAVPGAPGGRVSVPETFLRSDDKDYLRSQLVLAHAALQSLAAELAQCRDRLQRYEQTDNEHT